MGVDVETAVRCEGLRRSHSWTRRVARPRRRPDVRGDGVRDRPSGGPFWMGALMAARTVVILGSTGSVGESTLDLLGKVDADIDLLALTAGRNAALLAEQAIAWKPRLAVIEDESRLPELRERLAGSGVAAAAGPAAIVQAAGQGADWVMSAIVGAAGLAPTLAAARAGSVIGLANKARLVCAGPALLAIAKAAGGSV